MSDQHTTTTYDDPDLEWEDADEPAPPPRRPRRRRLTPVSGALAAIALVAGGFVAGVQVQKGQDDDGTGGAGGRNGGAFAARLGGGAQGQPGAGGPAAAGGASGATVGTVANVKGTTLYVTGADGTTVKVRTNGNSKVTRNADSSVGAVHPGDSVVIQGTRNRSGSVTATSIAATAKGLSAFGGLGALAGAAGTRGGDAPASGASPNSAGTNGVPQGFAPPQG
jgi:hypothetical protein